MRRTAPPSAEIQQRIDGLLAAGMVGEDPQRMLSELAKLGASLIIQRAVEEEFDSWLGRSRYERRPDAPAGKRNGFRPRRLQTGEGDLRVEIPQVSEAAEPFVSKLFPKWHSTRLVRTDPLKAMIVGAFVRGLSMRGVESLCEHAGLGKTSKSTAARICSELHEPVVAFQKRDLYEIKLVALFLYAIYLPVRPHGPKEGCRAPGGSPRTANARWYPCAGDARGQGGLARARTRSHSSRPASTAVDRCRWRPGADRRGRGVLAAR